MTNNLAHPRHRFFAAVLAGPQVELVGQEAHHALHVLRLKAGEAVEVFDGAGRRAAGPIIETRRDRLVVAVETIEGPIERRAPLLHLACALPKGKRLDWLLEKTAELGAASIQPLNCRFSAVTAEPGGPADPRWQSICASAVRQSGQLFLPQILPATTAEGLFRAGPRGQGLLADCTADTSELAIAYRGAAEVHLAIGPEGGWSEEERQTARAAGWLATRLGHTTLRVETAAVAMLAAVTALYGGQRS